MKSYIILLLLLFTLFSCSSNAIFDDSAISEGITVSEIHQAYSIIPVCYEMERAMIFYPGGLVQPDAYIPLAVKIAEELNMAVFIQKMPLNLAMLGSKRAEKILNTYDYIDTWYMGGHSLGGVMAASFIYDNPQIFDSLILLASYPMEKKSLKEVDISVLSINGTLDGLVEEDKINLSVEHLPGEAVFKKIEGGNHAQFGSYGMQKGDNPAEISEIEQQKEVVEYIKLFLERD